MTDQERAVLKTWRQEWRLLGVTNIPMSEDGGCWYVGIKGHFFLGIKFLPYNLSARWLTYDPRWNSYQHGDYYTTLDAALDDASVIVRKHLD